MLEISELGQRIVAHAAIALAIAAAPATLPGQLLLVVNTASGSSGNFCAPVACTPATVDLPAAFPAMQVAAAGGYSPTMFLLLALPPAPCVAMPGFDGFLQVQPPGLAAVFAPTWGHFPSAPCATWQGLYNLLLPAGMPAGAQFLVQLLAPIPSWTFSDAVVVTIV